MQTSLTTDEQLKVMVQLMGGSIERIQGANYEVIITMPSHCHMVDDHPTARFLPGLTFFFHTTTAALAALQQCEPAT